MSDSEHPASKHAILLLEDEPVSAGFLSAALAPMQLKVVLARSLNQARELLRQQRFSLLLLDLSLPDGNGSDLLGEIRADLSSPSHATAALALTAELDEARRAALRAAGFADALAKPITTQALRHAVGRMLASAAPLPMEKSPDAIDESSIWDDAAALGACGGSKEVLNALRGLFLKELPGQCTKIRSGLQSGHGNDALDELHRLLAGCGFCGAGQLAESARDLMDRVREAADISQAMASFEAAASRVLETGVSD